MVAYTFLPPYGVHFVLYMTQLARLTCFCFCQVPLEKYQVINQAL